MKSFNEIYQKVYAECGVELNRIKKDNFYRILIFIVSVIIAVILCISFKNVFVWFASGLIVTLILISCVSQFSKYKLQYKEKVIKNFVKDYSDTLEYYPQQGVSPIQYKKAGFDRYYDRYHTEDLIEGTILDNCKISMAEVHTEREETTTDSEGNTSTTYVTLFHGLFAAIDLDKLNTVSFMVTRNSLFSDSLFKGKNKLEMDSGEFEKYFDVKTVDKISTLRILTSDVMQMLLDFKSNNKVTPELSLDGNMLYIRFEVGDVFEPNLVRNDMDFDKLKKTYDMINFTLNLAEQFSKNIIEFEE